MHAIEVYTCTFTLKPTRSLNHLLSILYNIIIVLQTMPYVFLRVMALSGTLCSHVLAALTRGLRESTSE